MKLRCFFPYFKYTKNWKSYQYLVIVKKITLQNQILIIKSFDLNKSFRFLHHINSLAFRTQEKVFKIISLIRLQYLFLSWPVNNRSAAFTAWISRCGNLNITCPFS